MFLKLKYQSDNSSMLINLSLCTKIYIQKRITHRMGEHHPLDDVLDGNDYAVYTETIVYNQKYSVIKLGYYPTIDRCNEIITNIENAIMEGVSVYCIEVSD